MEAAVEAEMPLSTEPSFISAGEPRGSPRPAETWSL